MLMPAPSVHVDDYETEGHVHYDCSLMVSSPSGYLLVEDAYGRTITLGSSTSFNELAFYPNRRITTSNVFYDRPTSRLTLPDWQPANLFDYRSRFLNLDLTPAIFPRATKERLEKTIYLPNRLANSMDEDAIRWLASEPDLIDYANGICDAVDSELRVLKLNFKCSITTFSDPEEEDDSSLVIEYRIHDKSYEEIIEIWNTISLKVFGGLPDTVLDKITLTMEDE
jgi:hypothetical protein